jgi:hypothetical protein
MSSREVVGKRVREVVERLRTIVEAVRLGLEQYRKEFKGFEVSFVEEWSESIERRYVEMFKNR